jgi:hypothetical protein
MSTHSYRTDFFARGRVFKAGMHRVVQMTR